MNTHNKEIEEQVEEFKKTALFVNTINGRPDLNIPTEIHYTTTENKFRQALHTARTQGKAEERAFILNVLDGIDIADEEFGGGGTRAIRMALQSRLITNTDVTN